MTLEQRQLLQRAAAGVTCPADAVHIFLMMVGRVVVHNEDQLFDVQASRRHAGGDQQTADVALEVVDGGLAVALVLAAVQGEARVAHLPAAIKGRS